MSTVDGMYITDLTNFTFQLIPITGISSMSSNIGTNNNEMNNVKATVITFTYLELFLMEIRAFLQLHPSIYLLVEKFKEFSKIQKEI